MQLKYAWTWSWPFGWNATRKRRSHNRKHISNNNYVIFKSIRSVICIMYIVTINTIVYTTKKNTIVMFKATQAFTICYLTWHVGRRFNHFVPFWYTAAILIETFAQITIIEIIRESRMAKETRTDLRWDFVKMTLYFCYLIPHNTCIFVHTK